MKKNISLLLLLVFLQGCELDRSIDFILEEPKKQSENGVVFFVNWENGVPLYFFEYKPMKTSFQINMETDLSIENIFLESFVIKIPELGIDIKRIEQYQIDIMDTAVNQNSVATKRYWGGKIITVEGFLSDVIENEKQLEKFKKVKYIDLTVDITYIVESIERKSSLTWKFKPIPRKSSSFWNKLMSV